MIGRIALVVVPVAVVVYVALLPLLRSLDIVATVLSNSGH